jgi:hypothetical protein
MGKAEADDIGLASLLLESLRYNRYYREWLLEHMAETQTYAEAAERTAAGKRWIAERQATDLAALALVETTERQTRETLLTEFGLVAPPEESSH